MGSISSGQNAGERKRSGQMPNGVLVRYLMHGAGYETTKTPPITWWNIALCLVGLLAVFIVGILCQSVYMVRTGDVSGDAWFVGLSPIDRENGNTLLLTLALLLAPELSAMFGLVAAAFCIWMTYSRGAAFFGTVSSLGAGESIGSQLGKYLLYKKVVAGEVNNEFYDPIHSLPVKLSADSSIFGSYWPLGAGIIMIVLALVCQYAMRKTSSLKLFGVIAVVAGLVLAGRALYQGQLIGVLLTLVLLVVAFLIFPFDVDGTLHLVDNKYSQKAAIGVSILLFFELIAIFALAVVIVS